MQKKHHCDDLLCGKSFILAEHLRRHIATVHAFVEEKKPVKCDHPDCIKTYLSKDNMKKHYKQAHKDPKTHDCPHCGEKFTKKRPLQAHLYTHTGNYPQKCELCSAGFLNLKELRSHHAAKHSGGIRKQCPRCNLNFANWTAMVAHRKAVHPATYDCPHCSQVYYSKSKYKIHLVSHQKRTEQLIACVQEDCDFFANTRAKLIAHIRRNHGDKSFKCDECGQYLARESLLRKHRKNAHSREKVEERAPRKDKGILKPAPVIETLAKLTAAAPPSHQCAAETTSATDTESEASSMRQGSFAF